MIRPVGRRGLLVECAGADAAPLAQWLRGLNGVVEAVPAAATVLVQVARPSLLGTVAEVVGRWPGTAAEAATGAGAAAGRPAAVDLDVVYDGPDLHTTAELLGISSEDLVRRHTTQEWVAAFIGFAPGFAYLTGTGRLPPVPRRREPRARVPAGSVALADRYSAVYPSTSPGGWRLVGRTAAAVWDVHRDPPALLVPGTSVRFRPVRDLVRLDPPSGPAPSCPPAALDGGEPVGTPGVATLQVLEPGPLTLVEDLGRAGRAHLGVPRGGALDRSAAVRANRLVGNGPDAAVLEVLLGGLRLVARADVVLAVTGARVRAEVTVDEVPVRVGLDRPVAVPAGARVLLGTATRGLRCYVAVRGGLGGAEALGSRSTDVLSGLGRPLGAGDVLEVLDVPTSSVGHPDPVEPPVPHDGTWTVRVLPGPRADRLVGGLPALHDAVRAVGPDSNRIGLRLAGSPVRTVAGELPSEGTVPGAVQVPPSGLPVVFLADHPVTGGYPVVAVVEEEDLVLLAHARPGDRVRFVPATP